MTADDVRPGLAACPGREQLLAYHLGQLPAEAVGPLVAHLGTCPSCASLVGELDGLPDVLLEALLRPAPPDVLSESEARRVAILVEEFGDRPTRPDEAAPSSGDPGAGEGGAFPSGELGQYELLERLGAGAMGQVFKARHRLMDRVVALKVLHDHRLARPEVAARFEREIRALARLDHPNVVRALDADRAGTAHFLVMEHVEGMTLDRVVRERGPLPVGRACDCACQAALGLQHAFEHGLVHRDVKPSNLILTPAGQVKLLDLGLALFREGGAAGRQTAAGQVLGTLEYMAPEQWADTHAVDARADLYGLGCTLYHLLAGDPPFTGAAYDSVRRLMKAHAEDPVPPIRARRPDVPDGLAAVLDRLLAKDPARRYATPAEAHAALLPFAAADSPAPAPVLPPPPVPPPPPEGAARRRRPALVAGGIVLAALLLGALLWKYGPSAGPPRIKEFRVDHYREKDGKRTFQGVIGVGAHDVLTGDDLHFHVELSAPAYCFLLVRYPNAEQKPFSRTSPTATAVQDFPIGTLGLGSEDGTGLLTVVLVASRKPLPAFEMPGAGGEPRGPIEGGAVWHFDGQQWERLDLKRSEERGGLPQGLDALGTFCKKQPGVDAVEIVAFPVKKP